MADWFFEPFHRRGGFKAGAGRRLLEGTEMQQTETFARETLQNACDAAADPDRAVRVEYRIDACGRDHVDLSPILKLSGAGGLVERGLIQETDDLSLLYVEDFDTVGLGGTDRADISPRAADNFVRLCRNIGDTQETEGRGGTFGFGKSVYWSASQLGLVVFYSRFSPTDRTDGHYSRLIAVGWFEDHLLADLRYTGRAWFGDLTEADGELGADPLVDESADEMALALGFRARPTDAENGTSILIPGAQLADRQFLSLLRAAVEEYYWPRLLDGKLEVAFFVGDESLGGPDLPSRLDLRDYITAYRLLGETEDRELPENAKIDTLTHTVRGPNRRKWDLGRLATVVSDSQQASEDETVRSKGVALMRAPRMVVQYYTASGGLPEISYGSVYVASDELEDTLQKSEPPAHDRWSASSNELTPEEGKLVNATLSKIRRSVEAFLENFIEKDTGTDVTCSALGQALAKHLSIRGAGTSPGPSARLASIQFLSQPHRLAGEEGVHRVAATVQVDVSKAHVNRFKRQFDSKPVALRLAVQLKPVVETGQALGRSIGVEVLQEYTGAGDGENGSLLLPLDGPQEFKIQIVSEPLPSPELTVDMSVMAELMSAEQYDG